MSTQLANQSANFSFDNHAIRTVILNGDPWFFASDVCSAIALDNTAIRKLDDDEKDLHLTQTPGGMQEVSIISESGLYTIILRCRDAIKPGTIPYRFRKWVTSEVLPQIRKTGSYALQSAPPAPVQPVTPQPYAMIVYFENGIPVDSRPLMPGEIVMDPESIRGWLERRGLMVLHREALAMSIEKLIAL